MVLVSVDRFHGRAMFGHDDGVVESRCKRVVPILIHACTGCEVPEVKVVGNS